MQDAWKQPLAHSLSLQTSGAGGAAAPLIATWMRRCEQSAAGLCMHGTLLLPHQGGLCMPCVT